LRQSIYDEFVKTINFLRIHGKGEIGEEKTGKEKVEK
jgi:hypothetical protein